MFLAVPEFLKNAGSIRRLPPLGLLYIASYLKNKTDHEVYLLDAQLDRLSDDEVEEKIRAINPDIVGITTYIFTLLDCLETAKRAKRVNPDIFVVIGGSHAHIYPGETANLPEVDAVVAGEGEEVMAELANALAENKSLHHIPGIFFKSGGQVVSTGPRAPIKDLDKLPFPAREMLPKERFKFATDSEKFSTTMISTRGCRFKCTFCAVTYHEVRARSAENVVREMKHCAQMGIREINFYDDSFNYSEKHVENICREILNNDLDIKFSIRARVDKLSEKSVSLLKQAGCQRVNLGVEAADNEILRKIKKGITVEMATRSVKLIKDHGMEVTAYFMLGFPGQDLDGIKKTVDFAIKLDPDYAQFNTVFLAPATPMYHDALKSGAFDKDFYHEHAKKPLPSQIVACWEDKFTVEELLALTREAYRRFYLRPSYMWKSIKRVKSPVNLFRKGMQGTEILSFALLPFRTFWPTGRL